MCEGDWGSGFIGLIGGLGPRADMGVGGLGPLSGFKVLGRQPRAPWSSNPDVRVWFQACSN